LLLTPLIRPPEPPVPIKLNALSANTRPTRSLGEAVVPVPRVLSAMMLSYSVLVPV
jgi:hypothetical protein